MNLDKNPELDDILLLWRTRFENMKRKRHYFNQIVPPYIPPLCAKMLREKNDELDQFKAFIEGEVIMKPNLIKINGLFNNKYENEKDDDNEEEEIDDEDDIYALSIKQEMRMMYEKDLEKLEKKYDDEFHRIYKIQNEYDRDHPLLKEQCEYLYEHAKVMKLKEELELKSNFINYLTKKEAKDIKKYIKSPNFIIEKIEKLHGHYFKLRNKYENKRFPNDKFFIKNEYFNY